MITTKYGDEGFTNLNDVKMRKDSQVFSVLGALDEAMAALQMVATTYPTYNDILYRQVKQLYEISAIVAGYDINLMKDFDYQITVMEREINSVAEPVQFSLEYRTERAAQYNMARTIVRRAEREYVTRVYAWKRHIEREVYWNEPGYAHMQTGGYCDVFIIKQPPKEEAKLIMRYLNRLSDWLFVMAERSK
jgi:ATP:cob(I)alamin adenosyltransferase